MLSVPRSTRLGETAANLGAGFETVRTDELVVAPPPGFGFMAPMGNVPARCRNDAGIVAAADVAERKTVGSGVPPSVISVAGSNPVPVTANDTAGLPAITLLRETLVNVGTPFKTLT